jgi:hypothetical protein
LNEIQAVSINATLWEQSSRERGTPQATIEAVMYCVRERGLAALREPANRQRLMTFDDVARAEVNWRIAKLEEGRSIFKKVSENVS